MFNSVAGHENTEVPTAVEVALGVGAVLLTFMSGQVIIIKAWRYFHLRPELESIITSPDLTLESEFPTQPSLSASQRRGSAQLWI